MIYTMAGKRGELGFSYPIPFFYLVSGIFRAPNSQKCMNFRHQVARRQEELGNWKKLPRRNVKITSE